MCSHTHTKILFIDKHFYILCVYRASKHIVKIGDGEREKAEREQQ
jgi:hypothetical protein